jgi:hypothetical protein
MDACGCGWQTPHGSGSGGASFGYTVMGRVSLLIGRFQFLFQELPKTLGLQGDSPNTTPRVNMKARGGVPEPRA